MGKKAERLVEMMQNSALLGQMAANLIYDIFDKQIYPSLKLKINALNPFYFFERLLK
jgi:hypothetical protein